MSSADNPTGITVELLPDGDIRYWPGPQVKHGETVTFQLNRVRGLVEIHFHPTDFCLFPPGPYILNGDKVQTCSRSERVAHWARMGGHSFTVRFLKKGTHEEEGAEWESKKGEIEVTTDPTNPDKKQK